MAPIPHSPKIVWGPEFRATLSLAWPIILAQLAAMVLIVVDMLMVGRLGARPLAAVALGNSVSFMIVLLGGMSLSPINPLTARATVSPDGDELASVFRNGLWTALLLGLPISLLLANAGAIFNALGTFNIGSAFGDRADQALLDESTRYARALAFGIPFSFLYTACQNTLRGMKRVRIPLYIMLGVNLVNLLLNWVLIYGKLGAPALGSEGCAWATVAARVASFIAVIAFIQLDPELRAKLQLGRVFKASKAQIGKLLSLGLPSGLHGSFDYAIYTAAAVIITRLGAAELAPYQVVQNLIFLVLVSSAGIGQAGMIRLSRSLGEQQTESARSAMVSAYVLAGLFVGVAAALFLAFPRFFLRLYVDDPVVIEHGAAVLRAGTFFMVVNGFTSVGVFALMGMLDTRVPSIVHIALVWLMGLPLGYVGAVTLGGGAMGMWLGLATADFFLAGFLVVRSFLKLRAPETLAGALAG